MQLSSISGDGQVCLHRFKHSRS